MTLPHVMTLTVKAWTRFRDDRRGNTLLLFGLALVPLLLGIGSAVDYSQAARARSHLRISADAAALAAAKAAQSYMNTNGTSATAFTAASALAQIAMTQTFAANQSTDAYSQNVVAKLAMTQAADGSPIATVTASGLAPTSFMRIVGIPNVSVGTISEAKAAGGTYVQVIFVVDISNSMAIGGTPQDIANLQKDRYIATGNSNGTYTGCAFACHDSAGATTELFERLLQRVQNRFLLPFNWAPLLPLGGRRLQDCADQRFFG